MSDWKAGANKRRDARHTKSEQRTRAPHSRKNTMDWCRGKDGVVHQPVCRWYKYSWMDQAVHNMRCIACGKKVPERLFPVFDHGKCTQDRSS